MASHIFAFGQSFEGKLHPASLEILTPLKEVSEKLDQKLILLILADDRDALLAWRELKTALADEVWLVAHPKLRYLPDDLAGKVLAEIALEHRPFGFFFPSTKAGLAIAPRVAAHLGTGLCAHVNSLSVRDGKLVLLRPTYGENIIASLTSSTLPVMATLALNAFPIKTGTQEPEIRELTLPSNFVWETSFKVRSFRPAKTEPSRLSVAKVVVAGGMGLKSKENFDLLFDLAELLSAEVGATRPVVYAGWTSADRMIGVSGVSVRPKLYLAFGISGAIQHTAGMEASEFIVAVNTDKEAPMMKLANLGLVCDAPSLIKVLIRKLKYAQTG